VFSFDSDDIGMAWLGMAFGSLIRTRAIINDDDDDGYDEFIHLVNNSMKI